MNVQNIYIERNDGTIVKNANFYIHSCMDRRFTKKKTVGNMDIVWKNHIMLYHNMIFYIV